MSTSVSTLGRCFAAGLSTGARTATASAVLSFSGPTQLRTKAALTTFAIAELAGDKHPNTPKRTEPPGLVSRATASIGNGAVIARRRGDDTVPAVSAALVGAIGGCLGGLWWREHCGDFGVSDLAAAFLEDGLAIGLALAAARG